MTARPDSGIDSSRAQAAYMTVFASFDAQIAAASINPLLTPGQRRAMIATLRRQQRQAAQAAQQWVLDDERAAKKRRDTEGRAGPTRPSSGYGRSPPRRPSNGK